MKDYVCKVYWEMCGEVTVEAKNVDEAQKLAMDAPLPPKEEQNYVSDSTSVDMMDVIETD